MHSLTPHTKFLFPLTQVAKACYHLCPQVTVITEEIERLMAVSPDVTPGKGSILFTSPYLICRTDPTHPGVQEIFVELKESQYFECQTGILELMV